MSIARTTAGNKKQSGHTVGSYDSHLQFKKFGKNQKIKCRSWKIDLGKNIK